MKVPSYNKENRKTGGNYAALPKGNYVCKIMGIEAVTYKNGHEGIKVSFDIAEGEYKDFYATLYKEDDREDKHWSYDAVYYITIPYDGAPAWVTDTWDTFWANVEDSNNGYVFTGDEKTVKGKTFGGIFRIEESENNGRVYPHVRLYRTRIAQDIRDGKVTYVPKDKLVDASTIGGDTSDTGFINVPDGTAEDLPF